MFFNLIISIHYFNNSNKIEWKFVHFYDYTKSENSHMQKLEKKKEFHKKFA